MPEWKIEERIDAGKDFTSRVDRQDGPQRMPLRAWRRLDRSRTWTVTTWLFDKSTRGEVHANQGSAERAKANSSASERRLTRVVRDCSF